MKKKVSAKRALWIASHKEQRRAYRAKWQAKNRATQLELTRAWRGANPDKVRAYSTRYYAENADLLKAKSVAAEGAKRARKFNSSGRGVTAKEVLALLKETAGLCTYCGRSACLTVDHMDALRRGGEHDISNLAPACRSCNTSKFDKPLLLWLAQRAARKTVRTHSTRNVA